MVFVMKTETVREYELGRREREKYSEHEQVEV